MNNMPQETENSPGSSAVSRQMSTYAMRLERRMLDGYSDQMNWSWSVEECGISVETCRRVSALILRTWRQESNTLTWVEEQRDVARKRYELIYRTAMESENLRTAIAAVDSIVRLDSLERSPISSTVNVQVNNTITNTSRETVAKLLDKARSLASAKAVDKPQSNNLLQLNAAK